MPRRNRVDPWGDLHDVPERGMLTGNRGCLVDDSRRLARHHASNLWISCVTEFRGWRHPLDEPRRWTPLFFLDDAVALAAGHRPCAFCRRDVYRAYRDAVTTATARERPMPASSINRQLASERLRRGSGLARRPHRITWTSPIDELPTGAVFVGDDGEARLIAGATTFAFSFGGWTAPLARPRQRTVEVVTPPLSVGALRHGYVPALHESIRPTSHTSRPVR